MEELYGRFTKTELEIMILNNYKVLQENVKECEAYDGWTAEEQHLNFCEKYRYNPVNLLHKFRQHIVEHFIYDNSDLVYLSHSFKEDTVISWDEFTNIIGTIGDYYSEYNNAHLITQTLGSILLDNYK